MAKDADELIQLATRIPRSLHREIKVHCVTNGISVMHFVATALEDHLRHGRSSKRRTANA
jgi:predicted HicB family RNase H-like nuclease